MQKALVGSESGSRSLSGLDRSKKDGTLDVNRMSPILTALKKIKRSIRQEEKPHFIRDYKKLINRLQKDHPQDLAMAMAVGSTSLKDFRELGDKQVAVLRKIGLKEGMSIYDLACGSGRTASALQRAEWKGTYTGADIMPELTDYLERTCPGYKAIVNTNLTIKSLNNSLDILFAWSLFTHLLHEETYLYMEDAKRTLKPGGVLIFSFLEFEVQDHWTSFINTVNERRHQFRTHLNTFLHRDQITLWALSLGFEKPTFLEGEENFWQSLAILKKPE